jgi:hypothetical protein
MAIIKRNMGPIRGLLGAAALVGVLSAGSALAATVTTTSVALANGTQTVNITDTAQAVDGGGSNIASGTIQLQTNIGVLNTYCVDLFDYIGVGNNTYNYTASSLTAGSTYRNGSATGTFTAAQVLDLTRLLTNANSLASSSSVNSAALQIAVWEIEYDTANANGSYTLGNSGGGDSFYITATDSNSATGSLAAFNQAQTWLNDSTGYQNGSNWVSPIWGTNSSNFIEYLTSTSSSQNLIFLATPEPSSIAMFGMAIAGLYFARRRKPI